MKLAVLNSINNQCVVVQKTIAKNYGTSVNEESLIYELLVLRKLLEDYFNS